MHSPRAPIHLIARLLAGHRAVLHTRLAPTAALTVLFAPPTVLLAPPIGSTASPTVRSGESSANEFDPT
jgi:hypothetical protein